MRDQQQPHAVFDDEIAQQFEDLLLQNDIERCCRLVGDQQFRPQRAGNGDQHALTLTARQFVRIDGERKTRCGKADAVEYGSGARFSISPIYARMPADAFRHLLTDRLDRVQRGHRLLKHHADVVTAQRAHLIFAGGEDVEPVEDHVPCRPRGIREQPHDSQGSHGLARSRFADKAHHFAWIDREIDVFQDRCVADCDRQASNFQQAHRARLNLGSRISLRPSPSRLRPSTVKTMAKPGKIARWEATIMRVWASKSMRPQLGIGGWVPSPT